MLTLLTREGCGLCEEFEQEMRSAAPQLAYTRADVDSREDWQRRWGLKIPVLLDAQGQLLCAVHFDASALPR